MNEHEDSEDFSLDSHAAWDAASAKRRREAVEREIAICKAALGEKPKRSVLARFFAWLRGSKKS